MNEAELDLRLWIDRLDSFGEALESIHAGDEDVFDAPVLQLRDDREPELRALVLRSSHAEDFFDPLHIDANREVNGFVRDSPLVFDFHLQRVEIENRIDGIERARLP